MAIRYKRILLKLSGEALAGDKGVGFDEPTLEAICRGIKQARDLGAQIGRTCADKIGMLATIMNCLAVADALEQQGMETCVMSSLAMPQVAQPFTRGEAVRNLEAGRIVLFGGGTGNPFFSTDSASALRAAEIGADVMFKATMVDGVYNKDPKKYPDAVKYDTLTFSKVLEEKLGVMDATAAALCRDTHMPVLVFDMRDPDNIARAVQGDEIGTLVQE